MPSFELVASAREALILSVVLSLPIVGVAAFIGLFVAAFQAASQIQDPTIAHLPRLLGVVAALVALGPWLGQKLAVFAQHVFSLAAIH